ncbi:aspartate aminotransferase family protein [Alteribacter keqinensis]|uniref:Aspartate aminotransferase family protein n=1 Tax=Alteribacter keqinensis TaxID=2483800 RepID=A0A3M7U079_9BACI|nr:aspartate aminotransferase family protein [Alteribacter keqinensis]RNA70095.1 aspartate aminotransferase family protein [Alteribacter keqinensis]
MAIHHFSHPLPQFFNKTKESYRIYCESEKHMPGGVTANIKHFSPYPIVMKHGIGPTLTDVDNNEYVDYLMSYGALALGHGHPRIQQALQQQILTDGTYLFGAPHELETTFAKKIKEYIPSMELLRYTNSGTEATLLALRLAYAFTGKTKVAKFEGHYHGGYNEMLYSINPDEKKAGPIEEPVTVPESAGLLPGGDANTIILPFNHPEACERLLKKHSRELAAVIIEPVQGGFIPADQEFITRLRKVTEEEGIVLIFDEVKTGFRSSLGGAQNVYQVTPDLTTLGKVVGGGFPFGIVGGKKEIMDVSSPKTGSDVFDTMQSKGSSAEETLFHSGTYNGHPMILGAGLATIELLESEFRNTLTLANELRNELESFFKQKAVPMKTIGMGTIFNLVFTNQAVKNYRDMSKTNLFFRKELDLHLINEGIYTKPLNRYSIATVHGDRELKKTMDALHYVFTNRLTGS